MTHELSRRYCRVLSGQRGPELSREECLNYAAESIKACLPFAEELNITLIIENHYKDDFWIYPEFAQKMDVFCDLIDRIHHPNFVVHYDPSTTYLADEAPLEFSQLVPDRVGTM